MNMNELLKENLTTTVGDNQNSDPQDVRKIRKKLNALGLTSGREEDGYIDKDLDNSIRVFQRDMGIKQDGVMKPNGETEQHINSLLHLIDKGEVAEKPFQYTNVPVPKRKPMTPKERKKKKKN